MFLLPAVVFTGTGILSTLVAQILISSGGGESWTMLLPLSNYAGMALAAFVPDSMLGLVEKRDDDPQGRAAPALAPPPGGLPLGLLSSLWRLLEVPRGALGAVRPAPPGTLTVPLPVYVLAAVGIDILGFWLHVQGIRYAGSALFQVIYCSVVVWAAVGYWAARTPVGSRVLLSLGLVEFLTPPSASGELALGQEFNLLQGAGIAMVMCGLGVTALGESGSGSGLLPRTAASTALVLYGLLCSVACAVCYGVVYTLAELLMAQPAPPRAQAVSARVGGGICLVLGSYILVAVLPRWGEVLAPVQKLGILSLGQVALGYFVMLLSAVAHSITYFQLMGHSGAVTTAIMQAARAVGVFVASALLLCSNSRALQIVPALAQESQCFTFVRGIATVLVCAGILVYAQGKQSAKAGPAYAAMLPDKARHSFSVENA